MFIPQGKALHQNLATSYIIIGALIEDLCEGGFSGVVEIVLRETDAHIIIDGGTVTAALERRGEQYTPTSVAKLTQLAQKERGRVSVYNYPRGVASAIAGRIRAEALYTGLSSEFADLDKMVAKFLRERDRQWFVEVKTTSGTTALIHIQDDRFRIITPGEAFAEIESGRLNLYDNATLRTLFDECKTGGGVFDVYFKRPGSDDAPMLAENESTEIEEVEPSVTQDSFVVISDPESEFAAVPDQPEAAPAPAIASQIVETDFEVEMGSPIEPHTNESLLAEELAGGESFIPMTEEPSPAPLESQKAEFSKPLPATAAEASQGISPNTMRLFATTAQQEFLLAEAPEAVPTIAPTETTEMEEVKRWLGEIAHIIEEVARAAEPGESFPLSLRAGQLRIADRYPFLDPFGSEFEYLAGEIVFVGKTMPANFVAGLTEALQLAVEDLLVTSAQPARLHAFISEDLHALLDRNRAALERYGLDQSIAQILTQS